MSGKRTKALRREFFRIHHRAPELIEAQKGHTITMNAAKWKTRWAAILKTWAPLKAQLLGNLVANPPEIQVMPTNEFRRFRRGLARLAA